MRVRWFTRLYRMKHYMILRWWEVYSADRSDDGWGNIVSTKERKW